LHLEGFAMTRFALAKLSCAWVVIGLAFLAGSAHAQNTVWNPAANGIVPPDSGNWNVAANWTNGLPAANKGVFNVADAADCIVTDAQTFDQLVQGDNGPGGLLTVQNGGSLTIGAGWGAIGYNNSAHTIVESGGSITFTDHMWIGFTGSGNGLLDINGGTVTVEGQIGLGWQNSGAASNLGFVNVNDGLLALDRISGSDSIGDGSVLDISFGRVTIPESELGDIENYIAAGKITAFGGSGTLQTDIADGVLTIKAVPEPSSMVLLGLAGICLGAVSLLRRRRAA
jgi:hypothetical protein